MKIIPCDITIARSWAQTTRLIMESKGALLRHRRIAISSAILLNTESRV